MRIIQYLRSLTSKKLDIKIFKEKHNFYQAIKIVNTIGFSRFTSEKIVYEIPQKKKIIILAPHPDDELIGAGGTLIETLKRKCSIEIIYLTSGKKEEKRIREKELREVCDLLSVRSHVIGGIANKKLIGNKRILQILNQFKPQIIFIPFILDDNPDHKKANKLFYDISSLLNKTNPSINYEVWSYQVYTPLLVNRVVDITNNISKKEKLIKIYKSQFKSRDWAHYAIGLNAWNSRFLKRKKGPSWAECFFVQSKKEYEKFCKVFFNKSKYF